MQKRGFTLAEVLITLGIIGVVSALTAPALSTSTQKAKIGPALARFSSILGSAVQEYMVNEELTDLSGVGDDTLYTGVKKLMMGDDITENDVTYYTLNDGTRIVSFSKNDGVIIDINGAKKPNQPAKDRFKFTISDNGRVYAYGSKASGQKTCNANSDNDDDRYACTGDVADNGWKAEY